MNLSAYDNPYFGQDFWGFFVTLFYRIASFASGSISFSQLASDEIQIVVLCGVAISSALVGTFLVLRRMTMLANALSHTILLGIVMAFVLTRGFLLQDDQHSSMIYLPAMLLAALFTGLLTTFFTHFLTATVKLQEDASIGLVFTSFFALGIVLVTLLTRNAHVGIEAVMGNVDALQLEDCFLIFCIVLMNITLFTLFFKEFKITTFDKGLAKALGFSTIFFDYLLMTQTSATSVGAFRAVGVLMVLAFITGPPLTARLLTHNLKRMLILSSVLGCFASLMGIAITRHILSVYDVPLSTSGVVVCVIVAIYTLTIAWHKRSLAKQ
jgi:manganese/zinc/iron transport system permease protein